MSGENITLQIVLAVAGSVALLVGLFGGGVKAKEIEVPRISALARIVSGLVGIALIATAIRLPYPSQPVEQGTATPAPSTPPQIASAQPTSDSKEPPTQMPIDPPIATRTEAPTATEMPTLPPTNTPSPSPTPLPIPEDIRFGSPGNPELLNPVFGWQPGNSAVNTYDLTSAPNGLTLVAGSNTGQWATEDSQPILSYPIEGNFETQVKVVFNPMWGHELATLGVRSPQDHNTWLRFGSVYAFFSQGAGAEQRMVLDVDDQGAGAKIKTSPYPSDTVYLKIARHGNVFDFLYSSDSVNWSTFQRGYIAEMPANAEIFLTVGSWGEGGISAAFYDFKVLRK